MLLPIYSFKFKARAKGSKLEQKVQTRKRMRVKDTREDHSRGALASKRYTRGPLARSTREHTLHARTPRSYSTQATRTRELVASGTLHLGGTINTANTLIILFPF